MSTTNTPNTELDFCGQFLTISLKTDKPPQWPDVQTIWYSEEYLLIPKCPSPRKNLTASKLSGYEFEVALHSLKDYAKQNISKRIITFPPKNSMKYNIKNGLIAIYTCNHLEITKPSIIWEENLKHFGYTLDKRLSVPFANGEAYYNKSRDELLAIW